MRAHVRPVLGHRQHVTKWTNAMLAPPPEHIAQPARRGRAAPAGADRFANAFNDPADFENFFYEPEKTDAYLAGVRGTQA